MVVPYRTWQNSGIALNFQHMLSKIVVLIYFPLNLRITTFDCLSIIEKAALRWRVVSPDADLYRSGSARQYQDHVTLLSIDVATIQNQDKAKEESQGKVLWRIKQMHSGWYVPVTSSLFASMTWTRACPRSRVTRSFISGSCAQTRQSASINEEATS